MTAIHPAHSRAIGNAYTAAEHLFQADAAELRSRRSPRKGLRLPRLFVVSVLLNAGPPPMTIIEIGEAVHRHYSSVIHSRERLDHADTIEALASALRITPHRQEIGWVCGRIAEAESWQEIAALLGLREVANER